MLEVCSMGCVTVLQVFSNEETSYFVVRVQESLSYDNYSGSIAISTLGTTFSYLRLTKEIHVFLWCWYVWMMEQMSAELAMRMWFSRMSL